MFTNDPLEQFVFFVCTVGYPSTLHLMQMYHIFLTFSVLHIFNNSQYRIYIFKLLSFIKNVLTTTIHINKNIYFPYMLILFLFLLVSNLTGMIPYFFTSTSIFAITFYVSLMFFIGINLIGIKKNTFNFFSLFIPKGVPTLIVPFLFLIEVISYFSRVFSLAIRLFANMLSGHILLKILMGLLWSTLNGQYKFILLSTLVALPLIWGVIFCVMGLELVIAFLQAYVFIVLVATYSNDAINLH